MSPQYGARTSRETEPATPSAWGVPQAGQRTGLSGESTVHHRAGLTYHCGKIQVKPRAPRQLITEVGAEPGMRSPPGSWPFLRRSGFGGLAGI